MKIDLGNFTIENNSSSHDLRTDCFVSRAYSGYILTFSFGTYKAYLVEWEHPLEVKSWREILQPPDENTAKWLDDYVRSREESGYVLKGCAELLNIVLPEYAPPEGYREYLESFDNDQN